MEEKFYYPTGQIIKQKEFIDFYSKCYYINNNAKKEQDINRILTNGISDVKDIIEVLCWKTGGKNIDSNKVKTPWKTIDANELNQKILKITIANDNDMKNLLENLCKVDGIGPVYAITLLYFASKGQYPIYDKFAKIAIDSILGKKGKYKELPTYNGKNIESIIKKYKEYIDDLEKIFGDEYKTNRDIDRALWVYGHYINNNSN